MIIHLDATPVSGHGEKGQARPTYKKVFGLNSLLAFADHGAGSGRELLPCLLQPGSAGSNATAIHVTLMCMP